MFRISDAVVLLDSIDLIARQERTQARVVFCSTVRFLLLNLTITYFVFVWFLCVDYNLALAAGFLRSVAYRLIHIKFLTYTAHQRDTTAFLSHENFVFI